MAQAWRLFRFAFKSSKKPMRDPNFWQRVKPSEIRARGETPPAWMTFDDEWVDEASIAQEILELPGIKSSLARATKYAVIPPSSDEEEEEVEKDLEEVEELTDDDLEQEEDKVSIVPENVTRQIRPPAKISM